MVTAATALQASHRRSNRWQPSEPRGRMNSAERQSPGGLSSRAMSRNRVTINGHRDDDQEKNLPRKAGAFQCRCRAGTSPPNTRSVRGSLWVTRRTSPDKGSSAMRRKAVVTTADEEGGDTHHPNLAWAVLKFRDTAAPPNAEICVLCCVRCAALRCNTCTLRTVYGCNAR